MRLMRRDVERLDTHREVDRINIFERPRQRQRVRHEKQRCERGQEEADR
jgi:hypothetical protein